MNKKLAKMGMPPTLLWGVYWCTHFYDGGWLGASLD